MSRSPLLTRACVLSAAVAASLLLLQVAGSSYTQGGLHDVLWHANDIPLQITIGFRGRGWTPPTVDALRAWNNAGSRFLFSWRASPVQSVPCRSDNRPTVIFSDVICNSKSGKPPIPFRDITLAVTHSRWAKPQSGYYWRKIDADVIFNDKWKWQVYDGRLRSSVKDFRRVAIHEFGHVLGLDHPDEYEETVPAIMNAAVSDIDRLRADDIAGVRALYGSGSGRGTPERAVSLKASRTVLTAEQDFTLHATVSNVGDGVAPTTQLRYWYWRESTRKWEVVAYDYARRLWPGAEARESVELEAPAQHGTHYYLVCAPSNNCSYPKTRVVVGSGGIPDLVVQSGRVTDSTLTPGQEFTFSFTVRNVGSAASEATVVRFLSQADGRTVGAIRLRPCSDPVRIREPGGIDFPIGVDDAGHVLVQRLRQRGIWRAEQEQLPCEGRAGDSSEPD